MEWTFGNNQNRRYVTIEELVNEVVEYSYQKEAYQSEKIEGDLLIALIVEKARWLQFIQDDKSILEKPKNENAYIGIAIHSTVDFHFVKNLTVKVSVFDDKGMPLGEYQHFYHPRPGLHNYGRNWALPGSGLYSIIVKIENLNQQEKMYQSLKFSNVTIQTGQHIS